METIDIVYLICFFLGLGFAIISGLLSGVFSGHADAQVDVGAHVHGGDLHSTMGDQVHFPLLSPVVLAMFISTFGGSGLIFKKVLGFPLAGHLPLAAVSAVGVALAVAYLFYKIFQLASGSSEASTEETVGSEAEVVTAIPADGVGEIAYIVKESRMNAPARSADGKAIGGHTMVKIVKILGNVFVVEKAR